MKLVSILMILGAVTMALAGCDEDERLVRVAQENARQQAEQNKQMAGVNKELAESRKEQVELQRDLAKQQAGVNAQRDKLESERKAIANQRHRDPIVAAAIVQIGLLFGCLAPLVLAGYLVYRMYDQSSDQVLSELLIEELTSDRPLLLPAPPGNANSSNRLDLQPTARPPE